MHGPVRVLALAVGTAIFGGGLGVVGACSSFGPGTSPAPSQEAGTSEEEAVLTFSCGSTNCLAGNQACCLVGSAFGCFGLDAGGCFSASDGGAEASAPPLLCTSYRNCAFDEECCYRPDKGSSCQNSCLAGYASLCNTTTDSCGNSADCEPIPAPPLKDIGGCMSSYPSGSSGTSGGDMPWR